MLVVVAVNYFVSMLGIVVIVAVIVLVSVQMWHGVAVIVVCFRVST